MIRRWCTLTNGREIVTYNPIRLTFDGNRLRPREYSAAELELLAHVGRGPWFSRTRLLRSSGFLPVFLRRACVEHAPPCVEHASGFVLLPDDPPGAGLVTAELLAVLRERGDR